MTKLLLLIIAIVGIAVFFVQSQKPPSLPSYQAATDVNATVSIFDESVSQITQIDISPDGSYMLVGTLTGTVWVYHKIDGTFKRQKEPFFILETAQKGFPPEEAGLTGIVFGADFATSGDVFLLYSFAVEKKSFRNRASRVTFQKNGDKVKGINLQQIFEANTPGTGSHQIQDGVGVMISEKPHLLFTVGEGFDGSRSLDPQQEAGKLMLIQRDGSVPAGQRPFPQSPKVQAIGIRNAPAIAINPTNGNIAIGDTGPNNYDRFLYGKLYNAEGNNAQKLSFNWDGSEDSLKKSSPNPLDAQKETVLFRWIPTETAVNIAFYENEKLPKLQENQQYVLVVLFGQTGVKTNTPGKKIMLGTLTHGQQNTMSLTPLVERAPAGEGKLGSPIGLAVDTLTQDIYFGDIMEGKIYKISLHNERR